MIQQILVVIDPEVQAHAGVYWLHPKFPYVRLLRTTFVFDR